jgi:hypothetical protein
MAIDAEAATGKAAENFTNLTNSAENAKKAVNGTGEQIDNLNNKAKEAPVKIGVFDAIKTTATDAINTASNAMLGWQ